MLMKKIYFYLKAVMRNNLNKLKPSAKGKLTLTSWKGGNFILEFNLTKL